mmetsp:Transcript_6408/g.21468  ORF Transcript_6408/g.21468 Transcript_6408/m.21468 type:complete len:300 (+) Transcript_6408:945-1844(+)
MRGDVRLVPPPAESLHDLDLASGRAAAHKVRHRRGTLAPVARPARELALPRAVPARGERPRCDGDRLARPARPRVSVARIASHEQLVPPRLQPARASARRRHRHAARVRPPLPHEGVRVAHLLVCAREEQPVLRRAAARAAHHVRVELLVACRRPLDPPVRACRHARPVRPCPEARIRPVELARLPGAEVALAPQALVDRPLRAPARGAVLAVREADVEVAAGVLVVERVDQVVLAERRRLEERVKVSLHRDVAVHHGDVQVQLADDPRHVVVPRVPQPAQLSRPPAAAPRLARLAKVP